MKTHIILFTTIVALNLAACSSPEKKNMDAQTQFIEEKTQTLQEYKECVKNAGAVEEKLVQCEALLKAIGALEGATINSSAPAKTAPTETVAPVEPVEKTE